MKYSLILKLLIRYLKEKKIFNEVKKYFNSNILSTMSNEMRYRHINLLAIIGNEIKQKNYLPDEILYFFWNTKNNKEFNIILLNACQNKIKELFFKQEFPFRKEFFTNLFINNKEWLSDIITIQDILSNTYDEENIFSSYINHILNEKLSPFNFFYIAFNWDDNYLTWLSADITFRKKLWQFLFD